MVHRVTAELLFNSLPRLVFGIFRQDKITAAYLAAAAFARTFLVIAFALCVPLKRNYLQRRNRRKFYQPRSF